MSELLDRDALILRAKELQDQMFFRNMTLTDNGTVSLLIQAVESTQERIRAYRERIQKLELELAQARTACAMAINAFERNDAIDWDIVAKNAAPSDE